MFKTEYLSSYNRSFRVGYCVYIEIRRLSPAPTVRALNEYERRDVTFSNGHL